MIKSILTTITNPFDPFEEPIKWRMFDIEQGTFCNELLARLAPYSSGNGLTEEECARATEDVIDAFIQNDPTGIYTKASVEIDENELYPPISDEDLA